MKFLFKETMQGLPSQILPKSSKAEAFGEKKISAKAEAGEAVEGSQVEGAPEVASNDGFASLFAKLTGKGKTEGKTEGKPSDVKSETGETLKNLLTDKNKDKTEDKTGEVAVIDPKAVQAENVHAKVEQKITKTSSNLDQLLNNLKGTKDSDEFIENGNVDQLQGVRAKKGEQQIKVEKSESPLDFLMNGAKAKNVSEATSSTTPAASKDIETLLGQKKVMTGEDYLKNMESTEKKSSNKLVLLNGLAELQKNNTQNVKGYGQGLSLLSDPLIKNTKDLATKEKKIGNSAIDELRSPDTKVGAELAAIKQDVIPGIQNNKNNQGLQAETQTQASQKVLDLSKINTANTTEIIKRISDYVEQNQVANKSSLDLTVKHESLGEFKIQVSKMPAQAQGQSLIDMQITTSSKEGHDFFVKNEVSLMKNLNQAGINLSDLRIISTMSESSAFGQSDSKQSSSFSQNQDGSDKQFMSFESNNFASDTGSGSERRKELWEEYQQRYGA
ncbi:MAG: hypothetical protein H7281_09465 [Bacteriovorax sp.]|nr:hypothetical protein [Bacteriovorax sp.]